MDMIVAVDENWRIGINGGMLTSIPEDMKFFRTMTKDSVVVMGRKTLESFPGGKPLKNRVNIVLTKNSAYNPEGVVTVGDFDRLFDELKKYPDKKVFCIGGDSIYHAMLPYCKKAYVTYIYRAFDADTDFPNLDQDSQWKLSDVSETQEHNGIRYEFRIYERVGDAV